VAGISLRSRIEAIVVTSSLQVVYDILSRMEFREVQQALPECPGELLDRTPLWWRQRLQAPLQIALHLSLAGIACGLGADPLDLVGFIRPDCKHATAGFSRATLLRPDRIWGGEIVYVCRTIRPFSWIWSGPDPLRICAVDGQLLVDRPAPQSDPATSTLVLAPGATGMVSHQSTLVIYPSSITRLTIHAFLAGIRLPQTTRGVAFSGISPLSLPDGLHPVSAPHLRPSWAYPPLSSEG
jgi:hypothetical protein